MNCQGQDEVDELWAKLTAGGKPGPCGWLEDRYGVSWLIIPTALTARLSDPDPNKAARAAGDARMQKIAIAGLRAAAAV